MSNLPAEAERILYSSTPPGRSTATFLFSLVLDLISPSRCLVFLTISISNNTSSECSFRVLVHVVCFSLRLTWYLSRGRAYITWQTGTDVHHCLSGDLSVFALSSTSRKCPPSSQTTLPCDTPPCDLGSLRLSRRSTVSEGWPDPVGVTDFGLFIQSIGLILHSSILPRPERQRVAPSKCVWHATLLDRKVSFM